MSVSASPGVPDSPPGDLPPYPEPPGCDVSTLPGTNGYSIASFICGIVAPCGAGLLSIVLGIIALAQVGKTGQRGRGLAIAGLVLTGAWVVVPVIAVLVLSLNSSSVRDDAGEIAQDGSVSYEDLVPGDCVKELDEGPTARVAVAPCTEPHLGEVYAVFDLTMDGRWPGEDAILTEAANPCAERLARYSQAAYDDPDVEIALYFPDESLFRRGGRQVACVAYFVDGERTGSVAG